MGTLHRIKTSFIDISSTRNELPVISYNLFVKVEVYNARLGFRVLIGRVYISNQELIRIIDLNEATNDERREYFRISTRRDGIIFNLTHQQPDGTIKEYQNFKVSLVDISPVSYTHLIYGRLGGNRCYQVFIRRLQACSPIRGH